MPKKTSGYALISLLAFAFLLPTGVVAQTLGTLEFSRQRGLSVVSFNSEIATPYNIPLVSFQIGETHFDSSQALEKDGKYKLSNVLEIEYSPQDYAFGLKGVLTFRNISEDTLMLQNVVPFGSLPEQVYITGKGDHPLSRTHLFRPGFEPVNVVVPDNAWELGFSAIELNSKFRVCALARRIRESVQKGKRHRFETELFPGGLVKYNLWADFYEGDWQEGLRLMFQKRMLYDVEPGTFDNSMYERADLQWVRHAYVSHLIQNWDHRYFDYTDGKFHLEDFMEKGRKSYGGDDFIGIWPTWPTLGLDQRNQWDLFRDLPGGMPQVKKLAESCNQHQTRLFICYNPWDDSTRPEKHTLGMAGIIAATGADGVVLDTKGESGRELQHAADSVRSGVVMYSEGMAVPRDMQGIVSGRVHNALYYCPMLNLNKFIKPEFAIFRVAELYREPIRREYNVAFFNGYGTEMNIFAPGNPEWADEQYRYLGRTTRILRENTENFVSGKYTPLVATIREKVWVNQWVAGEKTIYTIYSLVPEGYKDFLFEVKPVTGRHFVDIWHHREKNPKQDGAKWLIEAETDAFNQSWLGTNNEGQVDCIAEFPELLSVSRESDVLNVSASAGREIRVWAGVPEYGKQPLILSAGKNAICLTDHFGRFEGRFIVQLFENGILLDERIEEIIPGTPRLVSQSEKISGTSAILAGMVKIPAGKFVFKTTHGDDFIPYPKDNQDKAFDMPAFLMDKNPVTNLGFKQFLEATHYMPADSANFLKHWIDGKIPEGEEHFPVVYVSYEDALAYSAWSGKRLPTEMEWQYAAQTSSGNEWPWIQNKPVKRVLQEVTGTLTVSNIEGIDPKRCNLGDGKPYAVGKYPKGANPFGLQDLVGCVWQLTNDLYVNGSYRYIILKGGSYFKPSSSWWYVQGGPRELHYRQQLLRVSEGFERNATVGFRCVKDF
jgi:formylglycine-generating enzyme required for sulfatase activity